MTSNAHASYTHITHAEEGEESLDQEVCTEERIWQRWCMHGSHIELGIQSYVHANTASKRCLHYGRQVHACTLWIDWCIALTSPC